MISRLPQVPAAYFTARTKTIFRSSSAKCYIAIQVCREMYEFDEDGERYYEKALVSRSSRLSTNSSHFPGLLTSISFLEQHGFLPELFARWSKLKTNHVVTVILFSRVCYDQAELERVEGPLYHDKDFGSYKDFVSLPLFKFSQLNSNIHSFACSSTKSASTWRRSSSRKRSSPSSRVSSPISRRPSFSTTTTFLGKKL